MWLPEQSKHNIAGLVEGVGMVWVMVRVDVELQTKVAVSGKALSR